MNFLFIFYLIIFILISNIFKLFKKFHKLNLIKLQYEIFEFYDYGNGDLDRINEAKCYDFIPKINNKLLWEIVNEKCAEPLEKPTFGGNLELVHVEEKLAVYGIQSPPKNVDEPVGEGEAVLVEASDSEGVDHADVEVEGLSHVPPTHQQDEPSRVVHPLSVPDLRVLHWQARQQFQ